MEIRNTRPSRPSRAKSAILAAIAATLVPTLSLRADEPQDETQPRTLIFSTQAPGQKSRLTRWGYDTAWANPDNVKRSILYMGKDNVDVVRVSFPTTEPLVDGDLPASKMDHFKTRLELAKLAGDKPWTMLPDMEAGVSPYYKDGTRIIPKRWVQLMAASQRHYGKKMDLVEPFNEPDYGWGQGSTEDLKAIMEVMEKSPAFAGVKISGPSTLNSDWADHWYEPIKAHVQHGTTHILAGTFTHYADFYTKVVANGQMADQPEAHNLVDVIAGAQYGVQQAIWWGAAERARGEFVKACHGQRLGYAENRPAWSAAAVYRAPNGTVQAFLGSAERNGHNATYHFVSRDRDVFFDGQGPRRDFTATVRRESENFLNITWGSDIAPVIAPGRYVLVNRRSGKVLAVAGADMKNGAALEQVDYSRAANQQWEIAPLVGRGDLSYVTIRAAHSGKCLDTTNWSYEEGAKIEQWGDGEAGAQHWYLDYAGDNCFYIRSRWSTKCLEVADGSVSAGAAIQQTAHTGEAQQWRLIPANVWPIDLKAPHAPAGLIASANPLSVELKWQANRDTDLASYTIFRSTTAGGPYDTIARGVTGNSFIDNKAQPKQTYYYVIKAVNQSFSPSAFSAEVTATPSGHNAMAACYLFDGNVNDASGNANHLEPQGSLAYGVGPAGSPAVLLDGTTNYFTLPSNFAEFSTFTFCAWVCPQGNLQWQRIFDLGSDEKQFFFLTPWSGDGTLRLAAKNGEGDELRLEAPGLPESQWAHVAVTLSGKTARLYQNGKLVASTDKWTIKPSDIRPIFNYIGKSQFAGDPLLGGRLANVRFYNYVLPPEQIAELALNPAAGPTGH